jgi:hypothetical protein
MVAAVSGIADREQRLRQLAEANVAVGSEISLENVLQKTVETAAGLVGARYAALGVLDRTGSHLEASSRRESTRRLELRSATCPVTTAFCASCCARGAPCALPT